MKLSIFIFIFSIFITWRSQVLDVYSCQVNAIKDSTADSVQTEISKSLETTDKTDALDYIFKWGIPSLFISLIGIFLKIVFDQNKKITELQNQLNLANLDKAKSAYDRLAKLISDLQQEYENFSQSWSEKYNDLKKQNERLEFLDKRERIYRELDQQFMQWHGVENCIVFTDRDKQVIDIIKFFDNEDIKAWLIPYDLLLLSIYWEICKNNYKKALQLIEENLGQFDIPPEIHAACYLQQARMLLNHKKNNILAVYSILEKAKQYNPANISIHFLEAKIRNDTEDFAVAALLLENIRKFPNANLFPIAIDLTLADVYINMKDYEKALDLVERHLIFHPYHVKSIKSKASIYCSNKNIDDATVEKFCKQIQTINTGDDPELHFAMALLEYRLEKYEDAEKRLKSIILKRPSFIEYRSLLANIYFELNKEEDLLKTLDILKTLVKSRKMKLKVERVMRTIEKSGLEKAKKTGRFNISIN